MFVNSVNHGFDPEQALLEIPKEAVGEIHLAGHSAAGELLIDDHGSRVVPAGLAFVRDGMSPIWSGTALIEWDTSIPPLDVLLDEAAMAARIAQAAHA